MDPPFVGRFIFTVDGLTIGAFTEVSGLSVQIDTEELAEGGQNQFTHRLPGRMKWPNLVFKRGLVSSDNFFSWLSECSGDGFAGAGNRLTPRNGSISVLGADGSTVVRRWSFEGAFPVKW